jgi:hypothetical protein
VPDLNKPAAEPSHAQSRAASILAYGEKERPPRWYLWEGGFLAVGQAGGEVPEHAHHAIQIFIAIDGGVGIRASEKTWHEGRGIIVRADVPHSFDARGATGAMLFVDPESAEGAWLQAALMDDITLVPDSRLGKCVDALRTFWERPLEGMEVGELVRHRRAQCRLCRCSSSDAHVSPDVRHSSLGDDARPVLPASIAVHDRDVMDS